MVSVTMALLVACGPRTGPAIGETRPTSADSLYIRVDNQSFLDATVYTNFLGSSRRRLGGVVGQTRNDYAVRWSGSEMFFIVDFIGSRNQRRTEAFVFRRGESIELRIPSTANQTGRLIVTRR
jgi:hypothetical protein